MQEWMIAMLVISIMLIIRDMAKTILAENLPDTEELPSLQEGHPQKERVEKYAASFQKLADTFYGMPYRKDYLSSRQVERIIEDTMQRYAADAIRGKSAGENTVRSW